MQKDALKKFLADLASDEAKAREAIIAWNEGRFKRLLDEADLQDATVEDILAIVKSGEIDTHVLEQANSGCEAPSSMGNCVP